MNEKIPSGEQQNLSALDMSEVTDLLKKYNTQFGWGPTAAREIMHAWEKEKNEEEPTDKDTSAIEDQVADQLLTFEQMKMETESLLETTGLEYQPVKANWFMASDNETHMGTEMRLNLKDGAQFVKYLKSLNSLSMTENQLKGLNEIVNVLVKQFKDFDLEDAENEHLLEFMGNVASIIEEYERIFGEEVSEDISKLERYLTYARNGCLREFRKVEELDLDKSFDGLAFNLRWHKDASPKFLQESWDSVIDTLQMISQNKKADEIFEMAKENASVALDKAIEDVTALPDTNKSKKAFLAILTSTKSRMTEF